MTKIIVDCDMGADGDDQFALAYMLLSGRTKVLSVNSAPFNDDPAAACRAGKAECEQICRLCGQDGIPVFEGAGAYMTGGGRCDSPASRNIIDTVESSDERVYIVVSGCATNVAAAMLESKVCRKRAVVIWLALADIHAGGNAAEYNFHNDHEAGRVLFELCENFILVPTRLIEPFAMTKDKADELFGCANPICEYLTRRFREISWAKGLWDLGAAGVVCLPSAYRFELADKPLFDENYEICAAAHEKMMSALTLDCGAVLSDALAVMQGKQK